MVGGWLTWIKFARMSCIRVNKKSEDKQNSLKYREVKSPGDPRSGAVIHLLERRSSRCCSLGVVVVVVVVLVVVVVIEEDPLKK